LHAELRQQAVVLSASQEQNTAEQFLQYLQGATATEILLRHGYTLSR
jgi:ABC-type molybdate transport system substrate-binding protein